MEMDSHSHKRVKLDADSSSSPDPFIVLHNDLHSLIYQHLCFKDVCELFKVSKQWNSRTSESPKGMEKIQLEFYEWSSTDPSPKSVTSLLQSQRMYQNIKFNLHTVSNAHRKLLILERFLQSVSFLDVSIVINADCTKYIPANLSFPKLKELRIRGEIPSTFFKKLNTLEKLCVCWDSIDDGYSGRTMKLLKELDIFKLIKDNKDLKNLELHIPPEFIFPTRSFCEVKFKLESLSINVGHSPSNQQGFHDFLFLHSETLTSLGLYNLGAADAEFILTKLPVLKELQVNTLFEVSKVKSNNTISSLKCNTLKGARTFLESLKIIESIEVLYYNEDDFRWVINNVMQLKKLKFKYMGWNNHPDFATITAAYNKFKMIDAPVNKDIKIVEKILSWSSI